MRWLYHVTTKAALDEGAPPASLALEGFVHASYRDAASESARLYFPKDAELVVQRIDPRRLDVAVIESDTPRGPMPHIHGSVPPDAVRELMSVADLASAPDEVRGSRVAFVAFAGMTLLDLVGVLDPLSRVASMGFDPSFVCEIVSADGDVAWRASGAELKVSSVRPPLDSYDAVIVAGGLGALALAERAEVTTWLASFPAGRLVASVCTGALLLGAAGRLRGRRATTHASALDDLARFGATPVSARVVDAGSVVTAGGVTAGIDLGLWLARRFAGEEAARRIAVQMEWRDAFVSRASEDH